MQILFLSWEIRESFWHLRPFEKINTVLLISEQAAIILSLSLSIDLEWNLSLYQISKTWFIYFIQKKINFHKNVDFYKWGAQSKKEKIINMIRL